MNQDNPHAKGVDINSDWIAEDELARTMSNNSKEIAIKSLTKEQHIEQNIKDARACLLTPE